MPSRAYSRRFVRPLALVAAIGLGIWALRANPPKIDHIELNPNGKGVTLHFEVYGDYDCDLQYCTNIGPKGLPAGPWFNLRTFPNLGPYQHYVWPDFFNTNTRARFYRLRFYTQN